MTRLNPPSLRCLLLASAISAVGCADPPANPAETDTGDSDSEDSGTETETGEPEPDYEPLLEDRSCPFQTPAGRSADCYTAYIPLDRTQLELGAVALPVAVLHPSGEATRPPVVYFHGGPGSRAFASAGSWFNNPLSEDGDLILFDQRGSGDALPSLDCPEAEAAWFASFSSVGTPTEEVDLLRLAYVDCRARLAAETDLDAFDSESNADDVEDLRLALGYESWSLYGISYGTRLAMEVMRRHPEGVRNVILDSVYPPQVGGVDWMFDSCETALDRLVAGCLEEPSCGATFPNLAADLDTAIANLDAMPYVLSIDDSEGVAHELSLTGADFYAGMYNALYDVELIPLVPFLIFSAAQGDFSFLVDLANQSIPFLTNLSEGARLSIDCADGGVLIDASQLAGVIADNSAYSTLFAAYALPHCADWDVEPVPEAFLDAVVSDIPTLLLAGEFDPVTPVSQSELAREGLSDSQLFVFPGIGHGASRDSECAADMTREFLRDSSVDSSCWSALSQDTF